MALTLKKFSFILSQVYLRDCGSSSFRGLFIRGLPVYTASNNKTKGTDTTQQEQNADSQLKKEKKTKDDQVISTSMARSANRSPVPPKASGGHGGKVH